MLLERLVTLILLEWSGFQGSPKMRNQTVLRAFAEITEVASENCVGYLLFLCHVRSGVAQ